MLYRHGAYHPTICVLQAWTGMPSSAWEQTLPGYVAKYIVQVLLLLPFSELDLHTMVKCLCCSIYGLTSMSMFIRTYQTWLGSRSNSPVTRRTFAYVAIESQDGMKKGMHSLLLCQIEGFFEVDVEICHHCTISTDWICKCMTFFEYCKEEGCLINL